MGAASNLLRRAVRLLPELDPGRLVLLTDLSEAMMEVGEFAWAELYLEEAANAAQATGDGRLAADVVLTRLLVQHHTTEDLGAWRDEVESETARLIPVLEQTTADAELAKACRLVQFLHGSVGRWEQTAEAQQIALVHARRAGRRRHEARLAAGYTISLRDGPTPAGEAIERCEEIAASALADRQAEAIALFSIALLQAFKGSFDAARARYAAGVALLDELGASGILAKSSSLVGGRIELLAGDAIEAERALRRDYDALGAIGEHYLRPLVAARLARALFELGNADAAEATAVEARESATPDDVEAHAVALSVQARAAAERGEADRAVDLAAEAVALLAEAGPVGLHGEALVDLALVLAQLDRGAEAERALAAACDLFRRKGAGALEARAETLGAPAV